MKTPMLRATSFVAALATAALVSVACSEVKDKVSDATNAASNGVNNATEAVKDGATNATDAAKDGAEAVKTGVSKIFSGKTTIKGPDGDINLDGEFASALHAAGGIEKLGAPTSAVKEIAGGKVLEFKTATLFFKDGQGSHLVQGEILRVYGEQGGPEGALGFPTIDEKKIDGGWQSDFEKGTITWTKIDGKFKETVTTK